MDGQVPGDTNFSTWLSRQSDARKSQVLGPVRYQLYKDGKSLEDFYSPTGEWLTLEQIKQQDSQAFAKMAA